MGPKKKIKILIIVLSILFVLLLASIYFFYTNLRTCQNETCFNNALIKCSRVDFVKDSTNTITEYKIGGISANTCKVNVKLLQVKAGSAELAGLEGQEMICYTPLSVLSVPENDLSKCHGILKEDIQDMIIQRMHTQIVENLGKISEGITKVL